MGYYLRKTGGFFCNKYNLLIPEKKDFLSLRKMIGCSRLFDHRIRFLWFFLFNEKETKQQ